MDIKKNIYIHISENLPTHGTMLERKCKYALRSCHVVKLDLHMHGTYNFCIYLCHFFHKDSKIFTVLINTPIKFARVFLHDRNSILAKHNKLFASEEILKIIKPVWKGHNNNAAIILHLYWTVLQKCIRLSNIKLTRRCDEAQKLSLVISISNLYIAQETQ